MLPFLRAIPILALLVAVVTPACAGTIVLRFLSETVGSFGGIGGDTFVLAGIDGNVTLDSGAAVQLAIDSVNWQVNDSGQLTASGDFDISRTLTLFGVSETVTQSANLIVTPSEDVLQGMGGAVSTIYNLGSQGLVVAAPIGFEIDAYAIGSFDGNAYVSLQWTEAPEPSSSREIGAGLALIAAILAKSRWKSRNSACDRV
jgi:hypothetical protein